MSVEKFINELQQRDLLSDRQLAKLREAAADKQMSPEKLAKFLVTKKHLTQQEAADVLKAVLSSGADLEAEPQVISTPTRSFEQEPAARALAPDAGEVIEGDPESSSVFESFLVHPAAKTAQTPPAAEDDELLLVPDDDDLESAKPADERPLRREEDLPALETPQLREEYLTSNAADDQSDVEATSADSTQVEGAARPSVRMTTSLRRSKKKKEGNKTKPKPKWVKGKSKWDSPLILLGGGGLTLLLLIGAGIWWLLTRESGDQKLTLAREAMEQGAYSQAIEKYEDFLVTSPRHPEHSLAQVQLALLRIRQATEASKFSQALDVAEKELKENEDEKEFDEAHGELAALLPQIAMGLAKQTEQAEAGSAEAEQAAQLANKALALCSNVTYIPKPLRDEGKLAAVRETLQHVERRHETKRALDEGLKAMQDALAAGDTNTAYTTYAQLLRARHELAGDASLAEMIQKTTAAEQAAIRFADEQQAAETADRPTPWVASLAVANRRVKPPVSRADPGPETSANNTAYVSVDGAVYGLDAATGKLLWRRHVGYAPAARPLSVDRGVIIADTVRNELLRLDAQTGQLQWRQAIGEPFAQPLIVGERGFVAAESGRLYVLDLKSGARLGYWQFAQPLRVTPTVDRSTERLYIPGDHSTVYTISLADSSCLGVYYLGHSEGSITVSPAAVMNTVAVIENDGVETSRLRLMSLGEQGAISGQASERRLTGLASAPPFVAGRRLIVITDRGQIDVYDIGSGQGDEALTLVATRAAAGSKPVVRYAALAERNIWIGDTQLTKYSILPTGNRLPVEAIENNFTGATFDHPLALFGDTLIHAHRPKGRAGVVVAATATAQGRTLWETDLAVPPAGAPVVDESAKALAAANAEGHLFRFDEAAIRSRVQDEPLAAQTMPAKAPALTTAVDLGQGRAAFCAPGSDRLLLYNPALGGAAAKWIQLEGPLACAVSPLGEGILAPLTIGQVFYLSAADGARLAMPFQPILKPQKQWQYKPAGIVDGDARRFVIADGEEKIYLVALVDQPQPHLEAVAEANAGAYPIESPIVVLGDTAMAVGGSSHLLRFRLPSLEPAGESNLPAPVVWGPFHIGDAMLLATANNQLMAISPDGEVKWQAPFEHGDLAGAPLAQQDSVLIAYRKGIIERRSLADGKPLAATDLEHPLASGPVPFMQRLVLAANDGTLLVVEQP